MINLNSFEEYIEILERDEGKAIPEFLFEILEDVYKRDQEQFKIIFQRNYKKELVELAKTEDYKN